MQWIGAGLVFISGFVVRGHIVGDMRANRQALSFAIALTEKLARDIAFDLTPVPRLLQRYAEEGKNPFCGDVIQEMSFGNGLALSWKIAAQRLRLSDEQREHFAALGGCFSYEEEGVQRALRSTAEEYRTQLAQLTQKRQERERLVTALCLSASTLLLVLLA